MAATVITICNGALTLIGADRIQSLDDDTAEAAACKALYEPTRDAVLAEHPWSCTLFRSTLALSSSTPNWGYNYEFPLPTSPRYLQMVDFYEGYPYTIEGGKLLTDSYTARIKYSGVQEDTTLYPPLLAELISVRLAAELPYDLNGSQDAIQRLWAMYKEKLDDAKKSDMRQDNEPIYINDSWIDARN